MHRFLNGIREYWEREQSSGKSPSGSAAPANYEQSTLSPALHSVIRTGLYPRRDIDGSAEPGQFLVAHERCLCLFPCASWKSPGPKILPQENVSTLETHFKTAKCMV
ncbi:uncharacterized protein ASCRUDRAFT_79489 [Ascoidea rubescens DSM 1968]|uniref:Uncharacterized protein n=1 Tax=Ascoidea rubescens DSM 1968 TaxID=1344418 RepID=A0A1D2VML4_9ASCO|nr:hypothetical protein ASCRUDRAFT_79489 [Ascoidea rubescens DSM 1968]ODV62858.1 hypothetical protein ASCRUDRAFT_79489 [Ascoidea rubescens DSM 1968]